MDLVFPHRSGSARCVYSTLSSEQRSALLEGYVSGENRPELAELLDFAGRSRLWLSCDCRSRERLAPMLFVRRCRGEPNQLVPMPDRPPHQPGCPFATMREAREIAQPALGQLLWRWFDAARVHVAYPYDGDDLLDAQFAGLREAARSMELKPGRNLYDYSRTHPQGLRPLSQRLHTTAVRTGTLASGVLLNVLRTPSLDEWERSLEGVDPELGLLRAELIRCPVYLWQGDDGTVDTGPHVGLLELAASVSFEEPAHLLGVFAHPVYSRSRLVPVSGSHERRTLRLLLEVQHLLWRSRQCLTSIRKVLPDAPLHERGLSFQVHRHGPNGRVSHTIDVYSVASSSPESFPVEAVSTMESLYHAVPVTRRDGSTAEVQSPGSESDSQFEQALLRRLLHDPIQTTAHRPVQCRR